MEWVDVFTRERYKHNLIDSLNFYVQEKGMVLYAWVLISDHFHCIAKAKNGNLSDIVQAFEFN